jgi:hypothetical protein
MFQRGNIIPVAFMIHDRRSGELHDRFFRTIKSLVPNLSKGTPVIVKSNVVSYETKSGSSDFTMRALLKSFRMSSTATMQHKSGKMVSSFRKS